MLYFVSCFSDWTSCFEMQAYELSPQFIFDAICCLTGDSESGGHPFTVDEPAWFPQLSRFKPGEAADTLTRDGESAKKQRGRPVDPQRGESSGSSTPTPCGDLDGRKLPKEGTCTRRAGSLCRAAETNTPL